MGVWEIGAEAGWMLALGMLLIAVGIAFDYGASCSVKTTSSCKRMVCA